MSIVTDHKELFSKYEHKKGVKEINLYLTLVGEEFRELCKSTEEFFGPSLFLKALESKDFENPYYQQGLLTVDAATDLIVVCLGLIRAMGFDPQKCWDEVHKSNMTKFPLTKREDGKVLKSTFYTPPNLTECYEQ